MIKEENWMNLHDFEMTQVHLTNEKKSSTLRLELKSESGKSLHWTFEEIVYLKMNNVSTQNVILDITSISDKQSAQSFLQENFEYLSPEHLQKVSEKIERKQLVCFDVQSSVGAEIKVVSAHHTLQVK